MPVGRRAARTAAGLSPLHAWVDKSMIQRGREGTYLLAAAVADPARCEATREVLRSLRTGREPKLHWNSENPSRRARIAAAIAQFDIPSVVMVGTPLDQRRQERARRCCMEELLPHLAALGVAHVWLEARTASLDAKDRAHVEAMRGRRLLSTALRIDIARPSEEPMLWLPDIVAGAVSAAHQGEGRYLELLRPMIIQLYTDVR